MKLMKKISLAARAESVPLPKMASEIPMDKSVRIAREESKISPEDV